MNKIFKDCYAKYENDILTIGNSKIERIIKFIDNIPVNISLSDKKDMWQGANVALFNVTDFDFLNAEVSFDFYVDSFSKNSDEALFVQITYKTNETQIKQIFYTYPEIPAISSCIYVKGEIFFKEIIHKIGDTAIETGEKKDKNRIIYPEFNVVDSVGISGRHLKLKAVKLMDETDVYDELVTSIDTNIYGKINEYYDGSVFILDEYVENKSLMLVSEGYIAGKKFYGQKDIAVSRECISVYGNGRIEPADEFYYVGGVTLVFAQKNDLKREYKRFYTCSYNDVGTYVMSNTWGDRKRDTSVNEDFIKRELDVGSRLGIDILQIDDGWQKGLSANSGLTKTGVWGDFYDTDPEFWDINKEKFPNGFNVIKEYAENKGITLGLWFSMDIAKDYARWEIDAKNVLNLYEKYGVKYFKIDGLKITNQEREENICKFVNYLDTKSGGEIKFNFDITANRRYGYFMHKEHSVLFVENRYTDWQNYYPHSTLRNLWSLSHYIPPHKMQFEVLNQLRNDALYESSPLRPSLYSIDYIFASVMVSNPLIWMEMTSLTEMQQESLSKIIAVYKKERDNFIKSDITPIGQRPNGSSYTGFDISGEKSSYLILLKEQSNDNSFTFKLDKEIKNFEILASNSSDLKIEVNNSDITVYNMVKSGYIFIKYNCNK